MNNAAPILVLLSMGTLSFLAGCSARVWREDESRFRAGAIVVGLIFIAMGLAGLFGYMDIHD